MSDESSLKSLAARIVSAQSDIEHHEQQLRTDLEAERSAVQNRDTRLQMLSKARWCLQQAIADLRAATEPPQGDAEQGVDLPDGFTPWSGGECPAGVDRQAEVVRRSGARDTGAHLLGWSHASHDSQLGRSYDIIGYRLIESASGERDVALGDFLQRDGAVAWASGERPVDRNALVEILVRDGRTLRAEAFCYCWRWPHAFENYADIIAYRLIEPASTGNPEAIAEPRLCEAKDCDAYQAALNHAATDKEIDASIRALRERESTNADCSSASERDVMRIETPVPLNPDAPVFSKRHEEEPV